MRKLKPRQAHIARTIDRILGPIFTIDRLFRKRHITASYKRILVVEFWHLGDIVLATPALQALRAAYPDAHITLLAAPVAQTLLQHQTVVDEIVPFMAPWIEHKYNFQRWSWRTLWTLIRQLRSHSFDLALTFRGDFRDNLLLWLSGAKRRVGLAYAGGGDLLTDVVAADTARHQAATGLQVVAALGVPVGKLGPRLWVSPDEATEARQWLEAHNIGSGRGPLVGLHPGAQWEGRRWEGARFARLAEALTKEFNAQILLLGGPADRPLLDAIKAEIDTPYAVAQPSLRQSIALIAACDLFIGIDSGPMHIATATGTPVVALFGPQRPEWFGPFGDGHLVAMTHVPCSPCDQIICHRPETSCMRLLGVDPVLRLARQQLRRIAARQDMAALLTGS